MRWHPTEIVRESLRNLNTVSVLALIFSALIMFGAGFITGATAQQLTSQEFQLRQAGSLIWVASAYQEQDGTIRAIPADQCMATQQSSAVDIAGGNFHQDFGNETIRYYPADDLLPLTRVLPGSIHVWDPTVKEYPIMVGADQIKTGAVRKGTTVSIDGTDFFSIDAELSETIGLSLLRSTLVLHDASITQLRECWVRMLPGYIDEGRQILAYYLGDDFPITQFLRADSILDAPAVQWKKFLDSALWLYLAAGIGLLIASFTVFQRPKYAIYRIFGASFGEVWGVFSLHTLYVLTMGYALALFTGTLLVLFDGTIIFSSFLVASTLAFLAGIVFAMIFGGIALRGDPLGQIRRE